MEASSLELPSFIILHLMSTEPISRNVWVVMIMRSATWNINSIVINYARKFCHRSKEQNLSKSHRQTTKSTSSRNFGLLSPRSLMTSEALFISSFLFFFSTIAGSNGAHPVPVHSQNAAASKYTFLPLVLENSKHFEWNHRHFKWISSWRAKNRNKWSHQILYTVHTH